MSLFALPFFAVGVWMLWSVSMTLTDAWRMDSWIAVEATVTRGGYETHRGDDSDTYEAYAEYTYTVNGHTFIAERVGLSSGADNIGSYQEDIGRNLRNAQGKTIMVWVNPDDPAEAVIDRGVRWGLMGFKSIFLFLFGGVGLGLLVFTWRTPKEKDKSDPRFADQPWLLDDAWQTAEIRSSSKASMYGVWIFAAFWNLISAPLPFLLYDEVVNKKNYLALVGLLFTAVGIGLLVWAVRRTLEWRRFGATPVVLDPFPGSIGGHVGGTIDLGVPLDISNEFTLTLTNIHSYESGSGKDRSQKEKAVWQDTLLAHAESCARGTRLTFRFDVPAGMNESDTERDDSYYLWRLDLTGELAGTNIDRSFDIPVYATGKTSRRLSDMAVQRAKEKQSARSDKAVLDVVSIRTGARGRSMYYPAGRYLGGSLIGFVIGAVFASAGAFLVVSEGQTVFGSIFGGVGALVAVSAFYMMVNSLEVGRDANGFWTVRRVLGIPVRRRHMGSHEFRKLTRDSRYQTQGGGKHVMHYSIYAVDAQGHKVVVGEGFKGESEAKAAMRLIEKELGLTSNDRERPAAPAGDAWDPAGLMS